MRLVSTKFSTNGTMIDLQNIPNGKCIADMRCSSRHATAKIAQTRDYSSGHKSTDKLGIGSQTSSATKLSITSIW